MQYVALRVLNVDGEERQAGALVPEAASWPNLRVWVDNGYVAEVPDEAVEALRNRLDLPEPEEEKSVEDLRKEAEHLGLPKGGSKQELLDNIRAEVARRETAWHDAKAAGPRPELARMFEEMPRDKLEDLAAELEVEGRSNMNKSELAQAVASAAFEAEFKDTDPKDGPPEGTTAEEQLEEAAEYERERTERAAAGDGDEATIPAPPAEEEPSGDQGAESAEEPEGDDQEPPPARGQEGAEPAEGEEPALEDLTVKQLKELASDYEIAGRSDMNREQLIEAIRDHEASTSAE